MNRSTGSRRPLLLALPPALRWPLLLALVALTACDASLEQVGMKHDASTGLAEVSVVCDAGPELNGDQRVVIAIRNGGDADLTGVHLVVNDEFRAPIGALRVATRFGTEPLGRSTIRPAERLEFIFSHDISNGWTLRDAAGQPWRRRSAPKSLGLESDAGVGRWTR